MIAEDLVLTEAHCFECSKPIGTIPSWLADAKVKFQCMECRQRHPRVPGMADLDPRHSVATDTTSADADAPVEEEEEADDDDDDQEEY